MLLLNSKHIYKSYFRIKLQHKVYNTVSPWAGGKLILFLQWLMSIKVNFSLMIWHLPNIHQTSSKVEESNEP